MKNPGRPKEAHSWLQLGEAYIPESGDLGQAGRRTVLQAALTLLRHPQSTAGRCGPGAVSGPGLASAELGDFGQIHTDPRGFLHIVTRLLWEGSRGKESLTVVSPANKPFLGLLVWFQSSLHPTLPQLSQPRQAFVAQTMWRNLPLQAAAGQKFPICCEFIWHLSRQDCTELINAVTTSLGAIKFILWLN